VATDGCVVMPNHFHGILWFVGMPAMNVQTNGLLSVSKIRATKASSLYTQSLMSDPITRSSGDCLTGAILGDVIGAFKSITTNRYIEGAKRKQWKSLQGPLWQRNYYECIIRNDEMLNAVRAYIESNPLEWASDPENPKMQQ
jgi:REP element-mobilizing transposase RayT